MAKIVADFDASYGGRKPTIISPTLMDSSSRCKA